MLNRLPLRLTPEQIDAIAVVDSRILDDDTEVFTLDLGAITIEVRCENAGRVSDAVIRLGDRILEGAVEAADDHRTRTGHRCYCGTWLDRDDESCGDLRCDLGMGLVG